MYCGAMVIFLNLETSVLPVQTNVGPFTEEGNCAVNLVSLCDPVVVMQIKARLSRICFKKDRVGLAL